MKNLLARRSLVILTTVAALAGGVFVVNAAAGWVATAADLGQPPPNAAELMSDLEQERAYAATLGDQLREVASRATELETALAAAQDKAEAAAAAAAQMASRLAAAQAQLAALQAQMGAAAAQPAGSASSGGTGGGSSDGGEEEEHHATPEPTATPEPH